MVYKGERFDTESILDIKTQYKPNRDLPIHPLYLLPPPGVKRGFIKGEAIILLRTNSSETHFQEAISNFKTRLTARGYPKNLIDGTLSEVKFSERQSKLRKQTKKAHEGTIPFVTTYHPAVKNLKQLLMQEWSLIPNQPMLKNIYKTPPIISYRRGISLKDILVRAKL